MPRSQAVRQLAFAASRRSPLHQRRRPSAAVPPTPPTPSSTSTRARAQLDALKAEAAKEIDAKAKLIQEMVDQVFSFGELGMQEVETSKYLTGHPRAERLQGRARRRRHSDGVRRDVGIREAGDLARLRHRRHPAGEPKAGRRLPATRSSPARPGHGEGHNSGMPLNVAAAIVVKKIMERDKIPGTLVLWPGVAEEQMAGKAFLVRAGVFKDVDVTLFTHVGNYLGVSWGQSGSNALISAIFKFKGSSAHSAGAPWRGKSALDAVMLMAQAWEIHREHLELPQRSHYVIPDGGDQPNVVPSTASIWFYFRERDYRAHDGDVRGGEEDGAGRGADDRHADRHDHDGRLGVERALLASDRRGDVSEHQEGRDADVGREGSDARQGHPARARRRRTAA